MRRCSRSGARRAPGFWHAGAKLFHRAPPRLSRRALRGEHQSLGSTARTPKTVPCRRRANSSFVGDAPNVSSRTPRSRGVRSLRRSLRDGFARPASVPFGGIGASTGSTSAAGAGRRGRLRQAGRRFGGAAVSSIAAAAAAPSAGACSSVAGSTGRNWLDRSFVPRPCRKVACRAPSRRRSRSRPRRPPEQRRRPELSVRRTLSCEVRAAC